MKKIYNYLQLGVQRSRNAAFCLLLSAFCLLPMATQAQCTDINFTVQCTRNATCSSLGEITATLTGAHWANVDWGTLYFKLTDMSGHTDDWANWLGDVEASGAIRYFPNAMPGNYIVEMQVVCGMGTLITRQATVEVPGEGVPFNFFANAIRKTMNCRNTGAILLTFVLGRPDVQITVESAPPAYGGLYTFPVNTEMQKTYTMDNLPEGTYRIKADDGCYTKEQTAVVGKLTQDIPRSLGTQLQKDHIQCDFSLMEGFGLPSGEDYNFYWRAEPAFYEYVFSETNVMPSGGWQDMPTTAHLVVNFPAGLNYPLLCAGTGGLYSWIRVKGCSTVEGPTFHPLKYPACFDENDPGLVAIDIFPDASCEPVILQITLNAFYGICLPLTWSLENTTTGTMLFTNEPYGQALFDEANTNAKSTNFILPSTANYRLVPENNYRFTMNDGTKTYTRNFSCPASGGGSITPYTFIERHWEQISNLDCACLYIGSEIVEENLSGFRIGTTFTYVRGEGIDGQNNYPMPWGGTGSSLEVSSSIQSRFVPFLFAENLRSNAITGWDTSLCEDTETKGIFDPNIPTGFYTFKVQEPCNGADVELTIMYSHRTARNLDIKVEPGCDGYVVSGYNGEQVWCDIVCEPYFSPDDFRIFRITSVPEGAEQFLGMETPPRGENVYVEFPYRFSIAGTYKAELIMQWRGINLCVIDTISFVVPEYFLELDAIASYICPGRTEGIIDIAARFGMPPYTYTLFSDEQQTIQLDQIVATYESGSFLLPSATAGDKYYTRIEDACSQRLNFEITMISLEGMSLANANSPVCEGADLVLTAIELGIGTYEWYKPSNRTTPAYVGKQVDIPYEEMEEGWYKMILRGGKCGFELVDSCYVLRAITPVSPDINLLELRLCAENEIINLEELAGIRPAPGHYLVWYEDEFTFEEMESPPSALLIDRTGEYVFYVAQKADGSKCPSARYPISVNVVEGEPTEISFEPLEICIGATVTLNSYGEPGSWASSNPAVATVSGNTATTVGAGTCYFIFIPDNPEMCYAFSGILEVLNEECVLCPSAILCKGETIDLEDLMEEQTLGTTLVFYEENGTTVITETLIKFDDLGIHTFYVQAVIDEECKGDLIKFFVLVNDCTPPIESVTKEAVGGSKYTTGTTKNFTITFTLPDDVSGYESIRIEDVIPTGLTFEELVSFKIDGDDISVTPDESTAGFVSFVITNADFEDAGGTDVVMVLKFYVEAGTTGNLINTVNLYVTPNGGTEPDEPDATDDEEITPAYKVIYDPNWPGDGTPGDDTELPNDTNLYEEGDNVTVLPGNPKKPGWAFLGWSRNPGASNPDPNYDAGENFEMPDEDVTLYAVWEEVPPITNVSKTAATEIYMPDGTMDYTISFTLPADVSTYQSIRVEDVLPTGLTFNSLVSATMGATPLTLTPVSTTGFVNITIPGTSLVNGATVTLVLRCNVAASATGNLFNTVNIYITPLNGDEPNDPDDTDNETVFPPVGSITKTAVDGTKYRADATKNYTISFELPADVSGYASIRIEDIMPAGMTYNDLVSAEVGTTDVKSAVTVTEPSASIVNFVLPGTSLADNATVTLVVKCDIAAGTTGSLTNRVNLYVTPKDGEEPENPNSTDTETVTPVYEVTYDCNGCDDDNDTPEDPNNPYDDGGNVTVLPPGNMEKNCYAFYGWSFTQNPTMSNINFAWNSTAETFTPSLFTITQDTTLYAVWNDHAITIQFDSAWICYGDSVNLDLLLTLTQTTGSIDSYKFYSDNQFSVEIPAPYFVKTQGNYYVRAWNDLNCYFDDSTHVTVYPMPEVVINVVGKDSMVCSNTTVNFDLPSMATMTNGDLLQFSLNKNFSPVLTNADAYPVTSGATVKLYVRARSLNPKAECFTLSENIDSVTLHVYPYAVAATINATGPETLCTGSTATFTATSTGVTNPVFRWYSDDTGTTPLEEDTDTYTTSTLTATTNSTTYTYYVSVEGDNYCENTPATRRAISVTVHPTPSVTIVPNQYTLCLYPDFTFAPVLNVGSNLSGVSYFEWKWRNNETMVWEEAHFVNGSGYVDPPTGTTAAQIAAGFEYMYGVIDILNPTDSIVLCLNITTTCGVATDTITLHREIGEPHATIEIVSEPAAPQPFCDLDTSYVVKITTIGSTGLTDISVILDDYLSSWISVRGAEYLYPVPDPMPENESEIDWRPMILTPDVKYYIATIPPGDNIVLTNDNDSLYVRYNVYTECGFLSGLPLRFRLDADGACGIIPLDTTVAVESGLFHVASGSGATKADYYIKATFLPDTIKNRGSKLTTVTMQMEYAWTGGGLPDYSYESVHINVPFALPLIETSVRSANDPSHPSYAFYNSGIIPEYLPYEDETLKEWKFDLFPALVVNDTIRFEIELTITDSVECGEYEFYVEIMHEEELLCEGELCWVPDILAGYYPKLPVELYEFDFVSTADTTNRYYGVMTNGAWSGTFLVSTHGPTFYGDTITVVYYSDMNHNNILDGADIATDTIYYPLQNSQAGVFPVYIGQTIPGTGYVVPPVHPIVGKQILVDLHGNNVCGGYEEQLIALYGNHNVCVGDEMTFYTAPDMFDYRWGILDTINGDIDVVSNNKAHLFSEIGSGAPNTNDSIVRAIFNTPGKYAIYTQYRPRTGNMAYTLLNRTYMEIEVHSKPYLEYATNADTTICQGAQVDLSVHFTDTATQIRELIYHYERKESNGSYTYIGSSSNSVPFIVAPWDTTTYRVSASLADSLCVNNTLTFTINTQNVPRIGTTVVAAAPTCTEGTGVIEFNVYGTGNNFSYSLNGVDYDPITLAGGKGQIDELLPGSYVIYVKDNDMPMCPAAASEPIHLQASNSGINVTAIVENVANCGDDNAEVILIVTGGKHPYEYLIESDVITTTYKTLPLSGIITETLGTGNYTFKVIDEDGCVATANATVYATSGLGLTLAPIVDADCSEKGMVKMTVTGGTTPYSYKLVGYDWREMNGDVDSILVAAGDRTIEIMDADGCLTSGDVFIPNTSPDFFFAEITTTPSPCGRFDEGTITISIGGTETPLYLSINDTQYDILVDDDPMVLTNMNVGVYEISLFDENGCRVIAENVIVTRDNGFVQAVDDYTFTYPNQPVYGNVATNDFDSYLKPLTVINYLPAKHGTITIAADGYYAYTPNKDYVGWDTVPYTVRNECGMTDDATLYILIRERPTGDAYPPVAVDDNYSTPMDTPVTDNVTDNDSDPYDVPFEVSGNTPPKNGTVVMNPNGKFTYTPKKGFTGVDQFDYWICQTEDPFLCDTATVTITVYDAPEEDPWILAVDDSYTVRKYDTLTIYAPGILGNDTIPDNLINFTIDTIYGPKYGTLVYLEEDGSFRYIPDNGFVGKDGYLYRICGYHPESGKTVCSDAYVDITVYDFPCPDMPELAFETGYVCYGDSIELITLRQAGYTNNERVVFYTDANYTNVLTSGFAKVEQMYYARAFNRFDCYTDETVYVVVRQPLPPVIDSTYQVFCEGATVADLNARGYNVMWYIVPTGGVMLSEYTQLVHDAIYYAADITPEGCESTGRSYVKVSIIPTEELPAPNVQNQTLCNDGTATVAEILTDGSNGIVFFGPAGNELQPTDLLISGTYKAIYRYGTGFNACESSNSTIFTITLNSMQPSTPVIVDQTFCPGAQIANIKVPNTGIVWYADEFDDTPLPSSTHLQTGIYWAAQTKGGICDTSDRVAVQITIGGAIPPPVTYEPYVFCDELTIADINVGGYGVTWYANQFGGAQLPLTTELHVGTHTLYAEVRGNNNDNCYSSQRAQVFVTVEKCKRLIDCDEFPDRIVDADGYKKHYYTHTTTEWDISAEIMSELDSARYIVNGEIYSSGPDASLKDYIFPLCENHVMVVAYFEDLTDTCEFYVTVRIVCPDEVDDIEGHTYNVTRLVGLCWTDNLRATKYDDGVSPIAWAKPYNSSLYPDSEMNEEIFGLLYTWYSAVGVPEDSTELPFVDEYGYIQGICPEGWHIPSQEEWNKLNAIPAADLKSTTLWINPGTNATGFNAFPAGWYNGATKRFEDLYGYTGWWSSDNAPGNRDALHYYLNYYCDSLEEKDKPKGDGLSVRCVLDDYCK